MVRDDCFQLAFYRQRSGREPVKEWLSQLPSGDRRTVAEDIKILQKGWPVGMPLARKVDRDLWELRSKLDKRIGRILFTVQEQAIVLLHAFIKKKRRAPLRELETARQRLHQVKQGWYEA